MNKRQLIQLESLTRAASELGKLPAVPLCGEVRRLRAQLAARLEHLRVLIKAQHDARQERTATSRRIDFAVRALRVRHLLPVSRRAKPLFKHDAAVLKALRLPPARATPQEHAKAALTMAKVLRQHVAFCHAEGFRHGFLPELRAAGTQLGAAAKASDAARLEYSRATWRLQQDMREARQLASLMDAELHALMPPGTVLDHEQESIRTIVAAWSRAYKLQKLPGRPRIRRVRASGAATLAAPA